MIVKAIVTYDDGVEATFAADNLDLTTIPVNSPAMPMAPGVPTMPEGDNVGGSGGEAEVVMPTPGEAGEPGEQSQVI